MAHEAFITPKRLWERLLIYWHTKNHSAEVYDIALILSVAIFTNQKIYEEELMEARLLLQERLKDPSSVDEVMGYIEMKLSNYIKSMDAWHKDQKKVREMLEKDQDLYAYLLNIFEADDSIDDEESGFENSLKKALLRS
jgi:hypothetical protein